MVELVSTGVVKELPVAIAVPPVAVVNQFIVPVEAAALSVTAPDSHRLDGVVDVITGIGFTVAVTAVRLAVMQLPLEAST